MPAIIKKAHVVVVLQKVVAASSTPELAARLVTVGPLLLLIIP